MKTNNKPSEALIELADRLYNSHIHDYFGAKDVLIWYSRTGINVAFKGDALRMELVSFGNKLDRNKEEHFETPGYTSRIKRSLISSLGVDDVSAIDGDYEHITNVRDGIEGAIFDFLHSHGELEEDINWTLMPNQGNPWNIGDSKTYYYSASKKKVLEGYSPKDIYEVTIDNEKYIAANVCKVVPTFSASKGSIVGICSDGSNVFASHTLSATRYDPEYGTIDTKWTAGFDVDTKTKIQEISKCGGFIFPSLALGPVAANTFGKITLVSYLEFVLSSLRPYKSKKGAWPVTVYDTDAWTVRTSEIVSTHASELFDQLTGAWKIPTYSYQLHFGVLGPKVTEESGPSEAKAIRDTKKLQALIKRRIKAWSRNATENSLRKAIESDKRNQYPYLEAKVNGVYSLDSFPLAVIEKRQYEISKQFLSAIGWKGDLITIDEQTGTHYKSNPVGGYSADLLKYSWLVHDAVVAYAESTNSIERILA